MLVYRSSLSNIFSFIDTVDPDAILTETLLWTICLVSDKSKIVIMTPDLQFPWLERSVFKSEGNLLHQRLKKKQLKAGFHMIATIAGKNVQRWLRSYGNHSSAFQRS